MDTLATLIKTWEFNRGRTLATLNTIGSMPNTAEVLGWRPGPGRAHIAWQLMHIGITEELFATERLLGKPPAYPDLAPRFKGGSTPDDDNPEIDAIREVFEQSRRHLLETFSTFTDADLNTVPDAFQERGWSIETIARVLAWHEPHHQGQLHLTLNLFKASHAG